MNTTVDYRKLKTNRNLDLLPTVCLKESYRVLVNYHIIYLQTTFHTCQISEIQNAQGTDHHI